MASIGIAEHRKLLIPRDQFVDQHLASLVMNIVIGGAVNQQQIPLQVFRKIDR